MCEFHCFNHALTEAASTSDAVSLITYVQQLKREVLAWEKQVDTYREAQRILERQRFQFPAQWLHVDNIEGEWSAFNEIMRRKDSSIQTQVFTVQNLQLIDVTSSRYFVMSLS